MRGLIRINIYSENLIRTATGKLPASNTGRGILLWPANC